MLDTIKTLCNIDGVSGREDAVRERIISLIKDHCEYSIDPLGSLICFKKGTCSSDKKIMFSAHMDEVFETNEKDSSSVSLRLPPDVCNANSLDNGVILFSPQEKAFFIC